MRVGSDSRTRTEGGHAYFLFRPVYLPNDMCSSLVDFPTRGSGPCAFFLLIHIRNPSIWEKATPTACISQLAPSAIYLKHRSQTHKTDAFSPPPFRRSPPANMSDVRPCARIDVRDTPVIRGPDADGPGGWWEEEAGGGSSISCSVRG